MFDLLMGIRKQKEEWKFVLMAIGLLCVMERPGHIIVLHGTIIKLGYYANNWDCQLEVCLHESMPWSMDCFSRLYMRKRATHNILYCICMDNSVCIIAWNVVIIGHKIYYNH